MKVALLFLLACAFTATVQSAGYVKGGTRYPWSAPNRAVANGSKTGQQNRRTLTTGQNRVRTRRADGSLSPAQSMTVEQNPAMFEEQSPIDFDMKVRSPVQFVPGLKSVMSLPVRDTPKA